MGSTDEVRRRHRKPHTPSPSRPRGSAEATGCLTHAATGPRRGHQRLSTEPSSPWMAHRDQGMIHTVYSPTRSTPSRSGNAINGTRALLGCGSCLGKERNRSLSRIETVQTLTLDLKSKGRWRKTYPWGLPHCHHHRRRCLGAHRADVQGESRSSDLHRSSV
jgi:hypothetical protein